MNDSKEKFWSLVEPEQKKAQAFCRKLKGNRDDGDDLFQDALVTALVKFDTLRDEALFKPWLYRIIINKYKNRLRSHWFKKTTRLTKTIEQSHPGIDPSPMYTARRRLEAAFEALNSEERAMVSLFELEGWNIAELANLFGKKEGAVKVKLSRCRKKMRHRLMKMNHSQKTETVKTQKPKDEICVAGKLSKN
ncbi:MAG: RNA polymerase sigma factor [Calditrichaeota bacterium]|nr:MAG: RNA polymerase sigma factor [Calditrichota bacterium]